MILGFGIHTEYTIMYIFKIVYIRLVSFTGIITIEISSNPQGLTANTRWQHEKTTPIGVKPMGGACL
jgi:hypothetical protein